MLFLCLQDIKTCSELPPACPQGLLFSLKIDLIFFSHNVAISVSPIHNIAFRVHETPVWNTAVDPVDPVDPLDLPDRRSELHLRPSLHTRLGSG